MLIKNDKLLKQSEFKLEKDIQTFVENHIPDILGEEYEFVCTEFPVGDFRIDSLAFNKETKSFIIIEDKKVENKSLVDQGLTYLKLLRDRKADFILKYNEVKNTNYNVSDIDISQSKVIFFSPYYNKYQIYSSDYQNIPFDLYKVTKYEDDIIDIEHQEPYGANRYKLEQWVADNFSNYLIVRLPGLFGINLKKNFIYDYIHYIPSLLNENKYDELSSVSNIIKENYCLQDNGFYKCNCDESDKYLLKEEFKKIGFSALNFTDSRGKFQFYNLANLWKDIELALKNNIKILNIATEPITIGELHKYLSGNTFINELNKNIPNYNFKSKYDKLYGGKDGYLYLKDQILLDIKEFVDSNASI